MQPQERAGITEDFIIPIYSVTSQASGAAYVSFTRDSPSEYGIASFQCSLKFVSKEIDPTSGQPEEDGYEDEYQLEDVELAAGDDYIKPTHANFSVEWDRLSGAFQSTETFALSTMGSLQGAVCMWRYVVRDLAEYYIIAACDSIVEILNMEPLGNSQTPTSTSVHTMQLSGLVIGGAGRVLVRCRMTYTVGQGVTLELAIRAERKEVCTLIMAAIGG